MTEEIEPMTPEEQRAVQDNIGLLWAAARSLAPALPGRAEPEDLVQEMVPVLLQLIRRYDPARGASLGSWVTSSIRGAMLARLRSQGFGFNYKPYGCRASVRRPDGVREQLLFPRPAAVPRGLQATGTPEPGPVDDLLAALDGCLDGLDEDDREVLLRLYGLRGRERGNYTTEAARLGLSREGARVRAVALMRRVLVGLGADPAVLPSVCKRCGVAVPVTSRRAAGNVCHDCRRDTLRACGRRRYRKRAAARSVAALPPGPA